MSLFHAHSISTNEVCKYAAGIAGNIFAFGVFLSPIYTIISFAREGSPEIFSLMSDGLPFSSENCLICLLYATPLISSDNLLFITFNSIGATFYLVLTILILIFVEESRKVSRLPLLLAYWGIFVIILIVSLLINDRTTRRNFVGFFCSVSFFSMASTMLSTIISALQTSSVVSMSFYLSLSTFLTSASFFLYGLFSGDAFIYVPYAIGTILGMIQLVLYFCYKSSSNEAAVDSTIDSLILSMLLRT